MGAERGVCELGDIRVKLNRRRYVAGDLLQGRVFFRTTKYVQSSDFVVHLEGREHISWLEQSRTASSPRTTPRRRHNKDILREKASLTEDTPTTYRPGEYELPFSFRLPESLPSSFEMKDRRLVELGAMESSIAYKVRATIRIDGALHPYIEGSRPFIVQRPPLDNPMRPLERSSSEQIRVFRVFSRGRCTLSASLDHNEVSAGDTVTVFTSVENQTSKDMTGISVQLVEDLAVDVPFRTQKRGSTVVCRRYFPGVRAKRQANRALSLNLVTETPWSFEPINPTMACNFVKWQYRLVVKCDFRLCSSVKVEFPVTVSCPRSTSRTSMARLSGPFSSPVGVEDVPLESDTIDGYSAKVDYSSSWLVINHALDSTSDTGETQDLIMWDQLTDAARTALENTDFGDANVPMKDANFETKLGNTYYA
ncbi:Arrestin domain-containing protein A [Phytophthora cinnamomi]|uniref:Arrestin domain-containing protein A n=1 Tax=Phytophthora cinnamomi TaxID=4785 RepID=UPI00355A089F|nr:Arrestin domain-containing protein A [Phytophthora cinnamomi]